VATALATRPRLLVLDEPTFGQDARTWAELVALLRELLAEGTALVAVTHDDALVRAVADDVLELRDGAPVSGERVQGRRAGTPKRPAGAPELPAGAPEPLVGKPERQEKVG
jgi:energy-coupling factor transporter ATP-binding protein EcfA2